MNNEKERLIQEVESTKSVMKKKETNMKRLEKEFITKASQKEKEIDELHTLLSKSYHSINSSIDNIRMAAQLDTEVQELTKKIKQDSVDGGNNRSISRIEKKRDEEEQKSTAEKPPLSMTLLKIPTQFPPDKKSQFHKSSR